MFPVPAQMGIRQNYIWFLWLFGGLRLKHKVNFQRVRIRFLIIRSSVKSRSESDRTWISLQVWCANAWAIMCFFSVSEA